MRGWFLTSSNFGDRREGVSSKLGNVRFSWAKLPRGNQKEAADVILKRRYSTREAAKLIGYLLCRPKWEYASILASPWEVVEPRQPRPGGFGAKLVMFREFCQTVLEGVQKCNPEQRRGLSSLIDLAATSAEEVNQTLRGAR